MSDFRDVLADMQPEETLAGYAARVKRERDDLEHACSVLHEASEHYRKERDEMAAHVERLRKYLARTYRQGRCDARISEGKKLLAETPAQSLAAMRAKAVDKALREYADQWLEPQVKGPFERELISADIREYAYRLQQLRNGSDDDE